jgi:hypothetical protein
MRTNSAIALGAMLWAFGAPVAGVSQDTIPYLQREAPKDTTLTGCVARGATTGTYILTTITKNGETAAADTVERLAVLLSGDYADVSQHVGHRVAVTGLFVSEGLVLGPLVTTEKPAAVATSKDEKKPIGTFRVKSLAMVANSCSQAAD